MGGVVTNTFKFDIIYSKLGITKEIFFDICRKKDDLWSKLEKGQIGTDVFWNSFNEMVEELKAGGRDSVDYSKIPVVKNDLFRLYFHPSKNPVTIQLIEKLKKNNRVVCGTNTIQSHWENHMERGDYAFFNQTYASNKIGEAKPNPEFFKLILEAENCAPENAFFTDDKIENVEAAKSVGINAVLFTSAEDLTKAWEKYINLV